VAWALRRNPAPSAAPRARCGRVTGVLPRVAVLALDGTPVPGLYAAGNAAAFWTGDAYPAPGATLGIGMTMGYIAGRHAATC